MRFGLIHRLMTDALATLGVLSLVASGKLNPIATGLVLLGLVVALALPDRWKQGTFARFVGGTLPLVILGIQLLRLFLAVETIPIIVEFAAALQVIRLGTRRGAAHDHQVILLALLHLIAGTVLGGGLTYAVALIGFLILTPGALVLSHLRREVEGNYRQGARDRTGMPVDVPRILRSRRVIDSRFLLFTCLLSLPVFLLTALLFLAFPRVGFTWLVVSPIKPNRIVGFSDKVELGGVGVIRTDPTLVMRVVPGQLSAEPPLRKNLYLKGATFDKYDGHGWQRSARITHAQDVDMSLVPLDRYPRETDEVWKIELEPIQPPVVFLPAEAIALELTEETRRPARYRAFVHFGSYGEIEYTSPDQSGLAYRAYVPKGGRFAEPRRAILTEAYLTVPDDLSPRIRALAEEWGRGLEDPVAIANRFQERLRTGYRYDLGSPSGGAADPLDHFLFESKAGHCEFYSTAMAVMLRTLEIPTRNVTGFVGGSYNRFGEFYAVRQGDAHSWVEVFLPGLGWQRFDPTPPSMVRHDAANQSVFSTLRELAEALGQTWDRHVVGFDLDQQVSLLQRLRDRFRKGRSGAEGLSKGWSAPSKKQWLLVAGLGLGLIVAVVVWRRRRRPRPELELQQRGKTLDLYRRLERALAAQGVVRPLTVPPLEHARALQAAGHPAGSEAVELTQMYLRGRFSGQPLSGNEQEEFLRRVGEMRKMNPTSSTDQAA